MGAKVIGIVGWSGSGKTSLIEKLLPIFQANAVKVGLIKHSHHHFEVDYPGKDTYRYRQAGCEQIIITSSSRYVYMREISQNTNEDNPANKTKETNEVSLEYCIKQFDQVDLILVEGFKCADIKKIEIYRSSLGKSRLDLNDKNIIAIATDSNISDKTKPILNLNNPLSIVEFIIKQISSNILK